MSWLKDWIYGRPEGRVIPFPPKTKLVYFAREVAPGLFHVSGPRSKPGLYETEIVCERLDGGVERRFYSGREVVM